MFIIGNNDRQFRIVSISIPEYFCLVCFTWVGSNKLCLDTPSVSWTRAARFKCMLDFMHVNVRWHFVNAQVCTGFLEPALGGPKKNHIVIDLL